MSTTIEQTGPSGTEIVEVYTPPAIEEAQGATPIEARADLTEEIVPSAQWNAWAWVSAERWLRALPSPADELTAAFGSKLYEVDMDRDPQVYSTQSILVMAVLAEGLQLLASVKPPDTGVVDPVYDASVKARDFCAYCIEHLNRPAMAVLYELIDGMLKMGHKVAEQIYALRTVTPEDGEQLVLSDLKCRPHEATAFTVDLYNTVLGLIYYRPNEGLPVVGAGAMGENELKDRMIPRSKFVIPTHKPKNGDPRGTTHVGKVYGPWWEKQQMNVARMQFMSRFAQGILYETLPPDANATVQDSKTGVVSGMLAKNTNALSQLRAGGVKTARYGSTLSLVESAHEGGVYFEEHKAMNDDIAKGLLMQTLTTEEGKHMARAASQTHQDVFGILIAYLRGIIEWTLREEVFGPLVRYNFGEDAMHLVPLVSLGDTEAQDQAAMMAAVARLTAAGYFAQDQFGAMDEMMGVPVRDPEAWAGELADRKQAKADAAKAIAAQGQPTPTESNADQNPDANEGDAGNGDTQSGDNSDGSDQQQGA
jgi:hypothetical protein